MFGLTLAFLVGYCSNGRIGGVCCFMLAGAGRIFLVLNHVLHQYRRSSVGKSAL